MKWRWDIINIPSFVTVSLSRSFSYLPTQYSYSWLPSFRTRLCHNYDHNKYGIVQWKWLWIVYLDFLTWSWTMNVESHSSCNPTFLYYKYPLNILTIPIIHPQFLIFMRWAKREILLNYYFPKLIFQWENWTIKSI